MKAQAVTEAINVSERLICVGLHPKTGGPQKAGASWTVETGISSATEIPPNQGLENRKATQNRRSCRLPSYLQTQALEMEIKTVAEARHGAKVSEKKEGI